MLKKRCLLDNSQEIKIHIHFCCKKYASISLQCALFSLQLFSVFFCVVVLFYLLFFSSSFFVCTKQTSFCKGKETFTNIRLIRLAATRNLIFGVEFFKVRRLMDRFSRITWPHVLMVIEWVKGRGRSNERV